MLNAPDHVLKDRVLNLPESVVAGTHNNEDGEYEPCSCEYFVSSCFPGFNRRLAEYKARNTEDSTLINYFDFIEIHPVGLFLILLFAKLLSCFLDRAPGGGFECNSGGNQEKHRGTSQLRPHCRGKGSCEGCIGAEGGFSKN